MRAILDFFVTPTVISLYWLNRRRRVLLKKRIERGVFRCLAAVARNISFMLAPGGELRIKGDPGIAGRGAVCYSLHFGIWELMPRYMKNLGFTPGVIVNRYGTDGSRFPGRLLDRFLRSWRSRHGARIFYPEDSLRIARFVRAGGLFGMLIDGNGRYDKLPKAAKLARLCNVPLVPFAVYRDRDRGILDFNCNLDRLLASRPQDYLWFYRSRAK